MKKLICNNVVLTNNFAVDYGTTELPAKDDVITWGGLRYITLRREFHDNGDIFIIVSQL